MFASDVLKLLVLFSPHRPSFENGPRECGFGKERNRAEFADADFVNSVLGILWKGSVW